MPVETAPPSDVVIVGGGIIGLSIAWELAVRGARVRLLERGETGAEASWAGAGVLPPGSWYSSHPAMEALARASNPMHRTISRRLAEQTGIEDGYTPFGALYLLGPASDRHERTTLGRWADNYREVESVSAADAGSRLGWPVGVDGPAVLDAAWAPTEATLRNPWRLRGMAAVCRKLGVQIETQSRVDRLELRNNRVVAAVAGGRAYEGSNFCFAVGCWLGGFDNQLGLKTTVKPIRGQMALLRGEVGALRHVVHYGGQYLVPRSDGRVLVGSTVEDVGFDPSTEATAIDRLVETAKTLAPALRSAMLEASWAGLRPATADGLPIVGAVPGLANAWIAGGHFRSGLQMAPATAVAIADLIEGHTPQVPLDAFSADRFLQPAPAP